MLERQVEVFADIVVAGNGVKKAAGNAVGIGVEKAQPAHAGDLGECVEQLRKAVLDAQVFAIAGSVLADQRDLLDAARNELLRLGDDRLEAARAEFPPEIGDDAEGTGMVAALGNLDVGRGFGGCQEPWSVFIVEVGWQVVRRALPIVAAEAALQLTLIPFGPRGRMPMRARAGFLAGACFCRAAKNVEGRGCVRGGRKARGFQDRFQFAGADDGVHFGNAL